jgi:ABC-type phosphate transport system permease subunit
LLGAPIAIAIGLFLTLLAPRHLGAVIGPLVELLAAIPSVILGLGRALGEAIAVTQVIGNFIPLKLSIFEPGDTIASRVANQYAGAVSNIQVSALIYLGLVLLVITFVTNLAAQRVVKRFELQRTGAA